MVPTRTNRGLGNMGALWVHYDASVLIFSQSLKQLDNFKSQFSTVATAVCVQLSNFIQRQIQLQRFPQRVYQRTTPCFSSSISSTQPESVPASLGSIPPYSRSMSLSSGIFLKPQTSFTLYSSNFLFGTSS
jgi:hypothetical protein